MVERGAQVAQLALHRLDGRAATGDAHLRRQAFRKRQVVLGVAAADGIRLTRLRQRGGGELAQDLELGHALMANPHQALRDQRVERRQRRARHRLRGLELGAADEDGERAERLSLAGLQQREAPFQRRADRLLARGCVARAAFEQRQRVGEPLHELAGVEQPDPPGGELDRERQAVEPAAQLGHRLRVLIAEAEVRSPLARAVDEQFDRVRHGQRRDREALLAAQPQRFTARGQHVQPRAGLDELAEQRAGFEDVLEVVDHQQGLRPPRRRMSASSSRSPGWTAAFTARASAPGTSAAPATRAR